MACVGNQDVLNCLWHLGRHSLKRVVNTKITLAKWLYPGFERSVRLLESQSNRSIHCGYLSMWAVVCLMDCDQRIHVPPSIMAQKVSYSSLPCSSLLVADRKIMPWVTLDVTHQKHTEDVSLISKKFYTGKSHSADFLSAWNLHVLQIFLLGSFCYWSKLSLITTDLRLYSRDKCACASPASQSVSWKEMQLRTWVAK